MEYTELGWTKLKVSRIAFGCEPLGGFDWGSINDSDSIKAVHKALDLGINFFDTADVYGLGRSEEMLSKALGSYRHKVVIATKFGHNWEDISGNIRARTFLDASPKRVVTALENSMRRLKLDTIPIYQIHWPDPNTPIEDTMEALMKCQKEGKIQYVGYSNANPEQLTKANHINRIAALQVEYNLGKRDIEKKLIPLCMNLDIGIITYGPLAQGLLTGKYNKGTNFGRNDRRHRLSHFQGDELQYYLEIVDRLEKIGQNHNKSISQVALKWVLEKQGITSVIVGIKTPSQVLNNVGALDWNLSNEELNFLEN